MRDQETTFYDRINKLDETYQSSIMKIFEDIDKMKNTPESSKFLIWLKETKAYEVQRKITDQSKLRDDWRQVEEIVCMSKYYSAPFITEISDFFIAKWVMKDKDKFDHFASL